MFQCCVLAALWSSGFNAFSTRLSCCPDFLEMWLIRGAQDGEKRCSSAEFFFFFFSAYSQNLQKVGPLGSSTASSVTSKIIPSAPACGDRDQEGLRKGKSCEQRRCRTRRGSAAAPGTAALRSGLRCQGCAGLGGCPKRKGKAVGGCWRCVGQGSAGRTALSQSGPRPGLWLGTVWGCTA